jgi:peroxiredoxin
MAEPTPAEESATAGYKESGRGAPPTVWFAALGLAALLAGFTAARMRAAQSSLLLDELPPAQALATARTAAGVNASATEGAGPDDVGGTRSPPDTGGLSYGVVQEGKANVGHPAPDFTLDLAGGGSTSLSAFGGQPVVLNFFATWCTPCRVEMPHLQAAYERHRDEGLVVLGLDVQESPEVVPPFLAELGLDFPVMLDVSGDITRLYRVRSMPTTYFIGADGVVAHIWPGMFSGEEQLTDALRFILPDL